MAGRGRGRGRGIGAAIAENRPGLDTNGPTSPKPETAVNNAPIASSSVDKFDELCKEFKSFKLVSSDELFRDLAKRAKDLSTSDDDYAKIIDILYRRVFQDNEFAAKVAQLGSMLSSLDDVGGKFRSCLLKRAQEHYKNKDNLKKNSLLEWTGLFCLLCEIFKVLRISGSPLKPLTGPIYTMLGELLQNQDDAEQIECFHTQFRNVGQMLYDIDKAKMDELVSKIRDTILSEKCSSLSRCLLTELLELRASNWSLGLEVERFYCDTVAEIQNKLFS